MGEGGPIPRLTGHPEEETVKRLRAEGQSIDAIVAALKDPTITRRMVETYCKKLARRGNFKMVAPDVVVLGSGVGDGGEASVPPKRKRSSLEVAEAHATWIHAQMTAAIKAGCQPREIGSLSQQYTTAIRLIAHLAGEMEVSASQIVKSLEFQRVLAVIAVAVGDNRAVWEGIEKGLAELAGDEVRK